MARPRHRDNEEELPKAKINKESIRESMAIFKYLRPYRTRFIIGLVLIAISSGAFMVFPYMMKLLIDSVHTTTHNVLYTPGNIALAMVGILVSLMIISFFRVYMFTSIGENAVADMRKDIYHRLITMPMDFFTRRRVGELSSRVTGDVAQIQDAVTSLLAEFIRSLITLIIGVGLIIYISPRLSLIMLCVLPIIIAIALVFGKGIRKLSRQAQDKLADSNTIVQETLQGISNVKAFANEWYERNRYDSNIKDVVRLAVRNGRFRGLFGSFMIFCLFGTIILIVWYATGLMQQGVLTLGGLTAFSIYIAFVAGTMAGFAELYSQLQKTIGATQRVRELLKEDIENVSVTEESLQEQFKLSGRVELRDISFSYPSRPEIPILKNIGITAEKGQQIALVGPSGAGKTTLASILLRFYNPDSGTLLFDGKDAADIPLTQLRKQMALVPQDVLLFGGTIFENIAYGKPGATQAEVETAARKANAHDFITSFPEGYQAVVGERGIKLSGGQRQRIAIARAILKDPVILILDEATSALDSESEQLVQEALQNLMKNRTSFVIAHRLSTIRNADKIVVLEDGHVKESGTHAELVAIDEGLYKNLNRLQLYDTHTS